MPHLIRRERKGCDVGLSYQSFINFTILNTSFHKKAKNNMVLDTCTNTSIQVFLTEESGLEHMGLSFLSLNAIHIK